MTAYDMEFRDYYQTLGLERSASADDIRKAYRRLARKYHPDVSKEKDALERFKQMQEAYEVLKDPKKRAAYDQLGANWKQGEDVIIAGSVSDEEAREVFGEYRAPRPYIRIVPQPQDRELVAS